MSIPVNAVDTYNLPVDVAKGSGGIPHNGELLHTIFFYSMHLKGVEIISKLRV